MDAAEHPTIAVEYTPPRVSGFAEIWGLPITLARTLAVVSAALFLTNLATVGLLYARDRDAKMVTPLLVQIDENFRPVTLPVTTTAQVDDRVIRSLLRNFVMLHLSRNRATLERDFTQSLYFLNPNVFRGELDEPHRATILNTFAKDGSKPNMEIVVNNVTLLDMDRSPFRALVDIEQRYSTRDSSVVTSTQKASVVIEFTRRQQVLESVAMVNPLGLQIERIRVDPAF